MKQIFDWLRGQIDKKSINGISESGAFVTSFIHSKIAKLCIDEAEAKWESECCEWKFEKELVGISVYKTCLKTQPYCYDIDKKFCPFCGKPIKISEVE
jgi:hypothetical protein